MRNFFRAPRCTLRTRLARGTQPPGACLLKTLANAAILAALGALTLGMAANAAPARAAEVGPSLDGQLPPAPARTTSAAATTPPASRPGGACSDQRLAEGVQLPDLPFFYSRIVPTAAYGSRTMVQLIQDAGRHMSWAMPQAAPFAVGDISRPGGGPISGHVSHRGGVDVDIGIYKEGGQQAKHQFLKFAPSQLDVAATWELIRFFLDSGKVDFILLDRGHIARIKAWTLQQGLLDTNEAARIFPPEGSRETWLHTGIVRHVPHHADHIHVRVLCEDGARAGF